MVPCEGQATPVKSNIETIATQDARKETSKFVLTNGDLSTRNIMVHEGRISGIIDWEHRGFIPEYMEYALAMVIYDCIEEWWLPVLKEMLEPCGYKQLRFIAAIKNRDC